MICSIEPTLTTRDGFFTVPADPNAMKQTLHLLTEYVTIINKY